MEFDNVRRNETRPRSDDTMSSCKYITTDKVIVSKDDITSREEIYKSRYPKDRDVGRIVIEEIPDEKEIPKYDISRKPIDKRISSEKTVMHYEVKDDARMRVKENVVKVGALDVTEFEKRPVESKGIEERVTTYKERVEEARKVLKIKCLDVL